MMPVKRLPVIFAMMLLCGCLLSKQPTRKIDYYTLEYDPPKIEQHSPLPFLLKVERFSTAPFYNNDKIVYRSKAFTRNTYNYHKWRALPGDLVSYFLARDLRASENYRGVFAINSSVSVSHVLEGTVDEFYEQDDDNGWRAVLEIGITLLDPNEPDISKKIIYQKSYRETRLCRHKNPRSLAESMSQALSQISRNLQTDLYDHLSRTPG